MHQRFLTLFASAMLLVAGSAQAQDKPNILLILADDLGWGDVGFHGSVIETPQLDQLASDGVLLKRYYAQPSCSPTRSSMMSGQSALRTGVIAPLDKHATTGLPLDLRILPQYFRAAGYQTWLVGKWHLGHATAEQLPNARGFDYSYGHLLGGIGHYDHIHGGGLDWHRNGKSLREPGHATDLLTADAIKQVENRDTSRPFFLYLSYTVPHLPNEAPPAFIDRYGHVADENRRVHAAMVSHLDASIGKVLQALEATNQRDNTLIWFFSDNGGLVNGSGSAMGDSVLATLVDWFGKPLPFDFLEFVRSNAQDGGADNGPYRNGKGFVYEGGVRVPSFLSMPGQLASSAFDSRVTAQDVLPTLLAAAGLPNDVPHPLDGRNAWPALQGVGTFEPPDFATLGINGEAYYRDNWKLVMPTGGSPELYDLTQDPTETQSVASAHPERVNSLRAALEAVPRGASSLATPWWRLVWDMDRFGGEEDRPPWADKVR